jgi:hypothetical protein
MKKFFISCLLIVFGLIAVCGAAAAPSKFAGAWILNREKSQGLTGALADSEIRLIVTQDDKKITTEQKVFIRGREQPSQEFTYKLDGSESSTGVSRPLAGTMNLRARWVEASKTLELTQSITGDDRGREVTFTTREQWQLADGGKSLKILRSRESQQGRQQFRLHFDREE